MVSRVENISEQCNCNIGTTLLFPNTQKACAIISGGCDGLLLEVASLDNGVVVDFDDANNYHQWTKTHSELAADCPTVKTQRGYHVYARLSTIDKPRKYKIRDQPIDVFEGKGQIVLPPSVGKDGTTEYTWTEIGRTVPTISDIADILPTAKNQTNADASDGPGGVTPAAST